MNVLFQKKEVMPDQVERFTQKNKLPIKKSLTIHFDFQGEENA
jgi:hypothetical protein